MNVCQVDIFMTVAFAAVHVDIQFLQVRLSQFTDTGMRSNLAEVNRLCQHCEASLQFLQSLCQQRFFRERLVKNKVSHLLNISILNLDINLKKKKKNYKYTIIQIQHMFL